MATRFSRASSPIGPDADSAGPKGVLRRCVPEVLVLKCFAHVSVMATVSARNGRYAASDLTVASPLSSEARS